MSHVFPCIGAKLIVLGNLHELNNSIPIILNDVACSGDEVRLIDCNNTDISNCHPRQDVALHCHKDG